ncbi:tRNA nucleotidyltransferase (CCA-adding enzyme) [Methanohalophilus levihalophilus]|uniref:CCA tRNA nucleotidyltransferase n=1 Tax=Methanohalophilus levihalophilus TaxID=1431282 RepID=UPI001AE97C3D|nr:CCA tRNA nucleotidyltransferase [Methanohalophilus levihalophilus]MBP2030498.1 tRNA nucleotidyltransferase (CCA-adding enzyme) [Methanohalophilus levihalophilus]
MDAIEKRVLERIKPSDEEKIRLENTASYLMKRAKELAIENDISGAELQLVGSAARGTWISGTHDLDIFISFEPSLPRKKLEEYGLLIGRQMAKEAESWEEGYAEHPYTKLKYSGFDVDIVPCYRVESAENIISAVDRTPFHNLFIKEHIGGLENDVLLLKQFMKAGGVYGSELKTGGFSGYLTELLVIHYGSFEDVLQAAASWKPGETIEMVKPKHGFEDSMVVIDPTDPNRNVAAALTTDRFTQFISLSRDYLKSPVENFFQKTEPIPMSDDEIINSFERRNTGFVSICFKTPDIVEDILYPQLFKMQKSVELLLEQHDFRVIKTNVWADEKSVLIAELENINLSNVRKHFGPPVWVQDHSEKFKEKHVNNSNTFSFYIEDGKYVAELPRRFSNAKDLLESELHNCALGKHIKKSIQEGYVILSGKEILQIEEEGYRSQLREFL